MQINFLLSITMQIGAEFNREDAKNAKKKAK